MYKLLVTVIASGMVNGGVHSSQQIIEFDTQTKADTAYENITIDEIRPPTPNQCSARRYVTKLY